MQTKNAAGQKTSRFSLPGLVAALVTSLGLALTAGAQTPTNLFFLHHSTGLGLITGGDMRGVINTYNAAHGTAFAFWDHDYNWIGLTGPDGVARGVYYEIPGDNTNPDGLHYLWTSTEADATACRNTILNNHQLIAFKSCFPNSAIADAAALNQYKTYYLAMRDVFDQHPDKLFMVFSTPPLRSIATNPTEANNARAFANWISQDYIGGRNNIVCFNLFDYLADAANNMLKAAYLPANEDPADSHPNDLANQTVGPILANFFITSALNFNPGSSTNFSAPGSVTASDGTYTDRVLVSWGAVAAATRYEVWRNTVNDSGSATALDTNVAATSYSDTAVTQDTVYWYWVRAANADQTSAFSTGNSGFSSATPPRTGPVIRANGATNEVAVQRNSPVTITVELTAGQYAGIEADWWVIAAPQSSNWYFLDGAMQWQVFTPGHFYQCTPAFQGPLFDLPATTALNALPLGGPEVYSFYFAVDQMDGVLNYPEGPMLYDRVDVTVE